MALGDDVGEAVAVACGVGDAVLGGVAVTRGVAVRRAPGDTRGLDDGDADVAVASPTSSATNTHGPSRRGCSTVPRAITRLLANSRGVLTSLSRTSSANSTATVSPRVKPQSVAASESTVSVIASPPTGRVDGDADGDADAVDSGVADAVDGRESNRRTSPVISKVADGDAVGLSVAAAARGAAVFFALTHAPAVSARTSASRAMRAFFTPANVTEMGRN